MAPVPMNPVESNANTSVRRDEEMVSPVSPARSKAPNYSRPGVSSSPNRGPTVAPVTPISQTNNSYVPQNSNVPQATDTTPVAPAPVTSNTTAGTSKRQSLRSAFKGLRGAGDAVRGAVNESVAHALHDTAEEERMHAIRKQGLTDWKDSGLRERVPVGRKGRDGAVEAEQRRRMRRSSQNLDTSVHGSEGPEGLGPLDEVESVTSSVGERRYE